MDNQSTHLAKVVNPELVRVALNSLKPYGEFKAYVRFASSEKSPACLEPTELSSPGLYDVRIPCNDFSNVAEDKNVLSIEIREHIT